MGSWVQLPSCWQRGCRAASKEMPGSSWLQPTHCRTRLLGWVNSLFLFVSTTQVYFKSQKIILVLPKFSLDLTSDGDWQEVYFSLPWSMTFSILFCPLSCWGGALREQRVRQPEPAKVSPPQINLVFWVFSVAFRYGSLNEEHSIKASTDSSLE